jgi:serine/threonine-protein kinase HipA
MKEIIVYADWKEIQGPARLGVLRADFLRGEEIFSFEYDQDWLKRAIPHQLDPDLQMFSGRQFLTKEMSNFGLFMDSSPDRWGRMLMDRKAALTVRQAGRSPKRLSESDYLLGVADLSRMGALRFKTEESEEFLARSEFPIPPMTRIRELEQASIHLEDDDYFQDERTHRWLELLLAPGSSLGGARPKASVLDPESQLWIAKFPSKNDQKDSGAWEFIVNQLAKDAGVNVSQANIRRYSELGHSFLTKRFDRQGFQRIHFASAMTMLGYKDGYDYRDGGSYLELLDFLEKYGASPDADIRELWRRIVFSVAVSNIDDHLRNHGFLLTQKGWRLSPAYDINPNERGVGLSLNISENDNSLDFGLCLSVAPYFRWKANEAKQAIMNIQKSVSKWSFWSEKLKISHSEQAMMETAFRCG